ASPVRRAGLDTLSLVAPTNVVTDGAEPAVLANYELSLEALARAGVTIRRKRVEALDRTVEMTSRHGTLIAAEAYTEYRDIADGEDAARLDRRVLFRMMGGKRMSAADVVSIQRGRQELVPMIAAELAGALLAMPTT